MSVATANRVGVISTIAAVLVAAGDKDKSLTRGQVLNTLVKRFPERDEVALSRTLNAQLGKRLEESQGITLSVWIDTDTNVTTYSAK